MKPFTLRALTAADVPGVMAIASLSFPKIWAEKDFYSFLEHNAKYAQGAIDLQTGRLVGYFIGLNVAGDLDIISIATDPRYRRAGIADSLLREAQNASQIFRITLEVDVENIPAYALYRKLGFEVAGIRKKYYEQTRDAYLMNWNKS